MKDDTNMCSFFNGYSKNILAFYKYFLDLSKIEDMHLTTSEENHIKTIYSLQTQMGTVSTNALAASLQTKPASVTDMLKKLQAKNLLQYEKYQGFTLNNEGRTFALQIIRRHRLWEYFLAEKLGFAWDEVHEMAEQLEHVGSKALTDRLDEYLGFPALDPHGDPIPDKNGDMITLKKTALQQLPEGAEATICNVGEDSGPMMELLKHYGMSIGTGIKVLKKFSADGSIEINIQKGRIGTLSADIAAKLFVNDESIR
jgi:DtxR family transcriptional regulator, Mn-dependent transcriptional regulator